MGAERGQRRSSRALAVPTDAAGTSAMGRVGGRLEDRPLPLEGGGYLNIHSVSNFRPAEDLRMRDLRAMGIPAPLLRAAEAIGIDAFLAFWRIIDGETTYKTDKGDIEFYMRPYRSYLRYQRNRYIEQLAAQGYSVAAIHEAVELNLCERINLRHIYRVLSGK